MPKKEKKNNVPGDEKTSEMVNTPDVVSEKDVAAEVSAVVTEAMPNDEVSSKEVVKETKEKKESSVAGYKTFVVKKRVKGEEELELHGEGYTGQDVKEFEDADEEAWQEIYSAQQNKKPLSGVASAIETHTLKIAAGKDPESIPCVVVYYGDHIKGLIPYTESGISIPVSEKGKVNYRVLQARLSSLLLGKTISVMVKHIAKTDNLIILSRKEALESMQARTWNKIKKGDIVTGIVRRVTKNYAVLNVGGIETRLPAKEMSHGWVVNAHTMLKEGENIKVKILDLDRSNQLLHISLKSLMQDKWETVKTKYKVDNKYVGSISGIYHYGIFIELEPGVTALTMLPNSKGKINLLKEGKKVVVNILNINADKRKIFGRIDRVVTE